MDKLNTANTSSPVSAAKYNFDLSMWSVVKDILSLHSNISAQNTLAEIKENKSPIFVFGDRGTAFATSLANEFPQVSSIIVVDRHTAVVRPFETEATNIMV